MTDCAKPVKNEEMSICKCALQEDKQAEKLAHTVNHCETDYYKVELNKGNLSAFTIHYFIHVLFVTVNGKEIWA